MTARVSRRVQRAQTDRGFTFKRQHFVVFDEAIDRELMFQRFGGLLMRRDEYSSSVLYLEMTVQGIHSRHVIRMDMGQNDLADIAAAGNQIVDRVSQRVLLIFIRRAGIDDQNSRDV